VARVGVALGMRVLVYDPLVMRLPAGVVRVDSLRKCCPRQISSACMCR
jgi:hypothetical protein